MSPGIVIFNPGDSDIYPRVIFACGVSLTSDSSLMAILPGGGAVPICVGENVNYWFSKVKEALICGDKFIEITPKDGVNK